MSTARRLHYSYEEYLALLAAHDVKLEYCDGCIYAMAGGTREHAALAAAVASQLRDAFRGKCLVLSSDAKIHIEATSLSTFPDASVVCGEAESARIDANATTNPTVLVEVTSASTEDYDRGDKLSHYKQIPSLRAVLFVSYKTPSVTVVERASNGWSEREIRSGETITLSLPTASIPVDSIYEGIALKNGQPLAFSR